jgi:predicted ATP-dependent endonuclease of OLD family
MKITKINLRNFKRFEEFGLEVCNGLTGEVARQFLIVGDNGTGKTTVLQAVALCLSMASSRTHDVGSFDWMGWVAGRYGRWGKPEVRLEVQFEQEEIEATQEAARRWRATGRVAESAFILPGSSSSVVLKLEGGAISAGSAAELFQFRGRAYVAAILKEDPGARELFESLPGVFWFDQFRSLASTRQKESDSEPSGRVAYQVGVASLREFLNRWYLNRISPNGLRRDFLGELETSYQRIFPGHSFAGVEPVYEDAPTPGDFYFLLTDGRREYDLEEMSAGEQAVFPMLYEFVRQQIRNSVVLIDEIDLNLHPPLAQALLTALPTLGPGCQFLFTTHSDAISSMVSPEQVFRLPGGRLCL